MYVIPVFIIAIVTNALLAVFVCAFLCFGLVAFAVGC